MSRNGQPAIDAGVFEAYKREQYVKDDGTRDMTKMRERVFEAVSQQKVLSKREREEKAITRGALLTSVFPNLPANFDDLEDDEAAVAQKVRSTIDSEVWNETRPDADGRIQRMVGVNMGNGYVLCRTKIGKDRVDAAYITDVLECIRLDFTRPDNIALDKRIHRSTRNREMLVLRQPDNAKAYAAEYDKTLRNALSAAHDQMQLTVMSVFSTTPSDEEETEVEEPES